MSKRSSDIQLEVNYVIMSFIFNHVIIALLLLYTCYPFMLYWNPCNYLIKIKQWCFHWSLCDWNFNQILECARGVTALYKSFQLLFPMSHIINSFTIPITLDTGLWSQHCCQPKFTTKLIVAIKINDGKCMIASLSTPLPAAIPTT